MEELMQVIDQNQKEIEILRNENTSLKADHSEKRKEPQTTSADEQVDLLKDLIKKKNKLLDITMEELKFKTEKCNELQSLLAKKGDEHYAGQLEKELETIKSQHEQLVTAFEDQGTSMLEMSERIDHFVSLLRSNNIPF